ncbi:MAG: carboxypeptidase-like regulatory domain-containing protein, partial [Bacteroidetes bacterium]|nr:carboxypeptidase-like regulatory domain-containing protein [Bacteroidota bacterium]
MKTTITFLLFFNMSLLFAQNSKLTGTIVTKNNKEKIAFATVAIFDATTKSFVKSTATDERGYY